MRKPSRPRCRQPPGHSGDGCRPAQPFPPGLLQHPVARDRDNRPELPGHAPGDHDVLVLHAGPGPFPGLLPDREDRLPRLTGDAGMPGPRPEPPPVDAPGRAPVLPDARHAPQRQPGTLRVSGLKGLEQLVQPAAIRPNRHRLAHGHLISTTCSKDPFGLFRLTARNIPKIPSQRRGHLPAGRSYRRETRRHSRRRHRILAMARSGQLSMLTGQLEDSVTETVVTEDPSRATLIDREECSMS